MHVNVYMYVRVQIHVYVHVHVMYLYMYTYMYIDADALSSSSVFAGHCKYICVYICVYVYTFTRVLLARTNKFYAHTPVCGAFKFTIKIDYVPAFVTSNYADQ